MSERRSSARLRKRFDPRDPDHFRTPDFRGKSSSSSSQGKSIKIIDSEQTPGGTAHETRVFPNGLTLRCKSKRGRPRGRPRGSGAAQSRGASGQQKAGRSGSNLGLGRGRGASQKRSGSVGGGADKQNAKRIRSKRLQDKAEHSLQLDTNLSTEQENSDRTNVADSTRSPPPPTTSTPNGNHIDSPAMSSDSTNLVSELSSDLHLSPSRPSVRQSSAGDSVFAHPGTPARAPPSTVSTTQAAARAHSSGTSPYASPFPVDRFPVTTDQRPKKRKKGQSSAGDSLFAHMGAPAHAPPSAVSTTQAAARAPSSGPSQYASPFPVDRFPVTTDQRPKKRKKCQSNSDSDDIYSESDYGSDSDRDIGMNVGHKQVGNSSKQFCRKIDALEEELRTTKEKLSRERSAKLNEDNVWRKSVAKRVRDIAGMSNEADFLKIFSVSEWIKAQLYRIT
eukprot:109371_1